MALLYLILLFASMFVIIYSAIWGLITRDSAHKTRPFIRVEWFALLVFAGLAIGNIQNDGWMILFAAFWLILSFVRFRQFVRYLDAKDAAALQKSE